MLHGFTGSIENWRPLVPHLADQFTVISADLPGHGKTAAPVDFLRYGIECVASDLVELMDSLGHKQFHLLGYSMGGRLALFLAINHVSVIKKLILESASPGLKTESERKNRLALDNRLADRIEQDGIEDFVGFWESISLWESQKHLSEDRKQSLRQIRLANNPAGLANSLRGMGTGQQPSQWSQLSDLDAQTLLITGALDQKFCGIAADMKPLIPNCQHQTILNAGHTIHLEKPAEWLHAIQDFLI